MVFGPYIHNGTLTGPSGHVGVAFRSTQNDDFQPRIRCLQTISSDSSSMVLLLPQEFWHLLPQHPLEKLSHFLAVQTEHPKKLRQTAAKILRYRSPISVLRFIVSVVMFC